MEAVYHNTPSGVRMYRKYMDYFLYMHIDILVIDGSRLLYKEDVQRKVARTRKKTIILSTWMYKK